MWCDETQQDGGCALSGGGAAATVVESSLFTKRMAAYSAAWFHIQLITVVGFGWLSKTTYWMLRSEYDL
jgi:hypothetical protein